MEKENRLIVADKGWAETVPEWLMDAVKLERELMAFVDLMPKSKQEVGDAELCLYLYTLCLKIPTDEQTGKIYRYLCTKLMEQKGNKVPKDIAIHKLSDWDNKEMIKMKQELWHKRGGRIHTPVTDAMHEVFKKDIKMVQK